MTTLVHPLEVKRYANRKLYVAEQGRYVNIQMLYQILMEGRDILVYCAKRHEDITTQMLGVIYQQCCVNLGVVPGDALLANIRAMPLAKVDVVDRDAAPV